MEQEHKHSSFDAATSTVLGEAQGAVTGAAVGGLTWAAIGAVALPAGLVASALISQMTGGSVPLPNIGVLGTAAGAGALAGGITGAYGGGLIGGIAGAFAGYSRSEPQKEDVAVVIAQEKQLAFAQGLMAQHTASRVEQLEAESTKWRDMHPSKHNKGHEHSVNQQAEEVLASLPSH